MKIRTVNDMNKTTLVIMAAGMGSRFGKGIKQLEHVGPGGEILMDYSIYDAVRAGFDDVLVIIRRDIEDEFRALIGDRISKKVNLNYVYQEMDNIPEGFSVPEGRAKPWGTGHAILSCLGHLNNPFAIINADDYYGTESFKAMHSFLVNADPEGDKYCMAGYILGNTLSDNGTVTRGICAHGDDMFLNKVNESFKLKREGEVVTGEDEMGNPITASPADLCSMNLWGCMPAFLDDLQDYFVEFLEDDKLDPLKKEYLLPKIIDKMIKEGLVTVEILPVSDHWFGLTYAEDKPMVVEKLNEMIENGVYPAKLWD